MPRSALVGAAPGISSPTVESRGPASSPARDLTLKTAREWRASFTLPPSCISEANTDSFNPIVDHWLFTDPRVFITKSHSGEATVVDGPRSESAVRDMDRLATEFGFKVTHTGYAYFARDAWILRRDGQVVTGGYPKNDDKLGPGHLETALKIECSRGFLDPWAPIQPA